MVDANPGKQLNIGCSLINQAVVAQRSVLAIGIRIKSDFYNNC